MRYREFAVEARKNPEKNPKVSVNTELLNALGKLYKNTGKNSNLFISFTSVDKLGINPTSKYNTPLGIYSYPALYVIQELGNTYPMTELPFAGDSEYATIFKSKGNIIDLNNITDTEANEYYEKIKQYWNTISVKIRGSNSILDIDEIINDATTDAKVSSTAGGRLWYVTMMVSSNMVPYGTTRVGGIANPDAVAWNKLFRAIGISGCIDNGDGIIHTSEPYQAVFFDIGAVDVIKRVLNKNNYSADQARLNAQMGADTNEYHTKQYQSFKNMDIESQMQAVLDDPSLIRFMPNPPDKFKYEVIKKNPRVIGVMKNPSDEMKKFAVKNNPLAILYLKKPSEELLQLAAGSNLVGMFNHILDAKIKVSETVQRIAVEAHYINFHYILDHGIKPSQEVIALAMKQPHVEGASLALKRLLEMGIIPSDAVLVDAVKTHFKLIFDIIAAGIIPSKAVEAAAGMPLSRIVQLLLMKGTPQLSPQIKQAAGIK
jgi:hypothetical protein